MLFGPQSGFLVHVHTHLCTALLYMQRALPRRVVLFLSLLCEARAMRLVLQRVTSASVAVDNQIVSKIGKGVLALVGLHKDDSAADLEYCAKKLCAAKLWENSDGKAWRRSARQDCLDVLLVSQFTLYGDVKNKKHVPDFKHSMKSAAALEQYEAFKKLVASEYGDERKIHDGVFGAMMDVSLVNDGPVTLVVDSPPRPSVPAAEDLE